MDALQVAKNYIANFEAGGIGTENTHMAYMATIQAYAAIAQAEQLKRIADNLDLIVQEWGKPHYIVNPILK